MRELAALNHDKAEYLKKGLQTKGVDIPFSSPTFHEFVVRFDSSFSTKYPKLLQEKLIPGLSLAEFYPELKDHYLVCVTETKSKAHLDDFIQKVTS